ncbi:MAG: hypothetical protein H6625_00235 [Bdellovibrionaceae bacterium]|nr:hypothetical protein [Pseudobdellovibrionaceae bacterium]
MKNIKITITFIMTALLIAACSKDKKSSGVARTGTPNGTVPGASCNGCSNSNRLYTAMGRTGSGVDLIMEFFASSVDTHGNPVAVDYTQGGYSGSVDGIGKMTVATGISCGYNSSGAYVPPGVYSIRVENPGQMDPYTQGIGGMSVIASNGAYNVRLAIDNYIYFLDRAPQMRSCDGQDYGVEMIGIWRVLSVNKSNCGNTIAFGGMGTQQNQLMCP